MVKNVEPFKPKVKRRDLDFGAPVGAGTLAAKSVRGAVKRALDDGQDMPTPLPPTRELARRGRWG